MKKRSAKASCQRDDRAFAEFEALARKLAKASPPQITSQRADANGERTTR
jgi:hypothetical protein